MKPLIKNTQYYIINRDEEMFYKDSYNLAVLENNDCGIIYNNYENNYIIGDEYIIQDIKYICREIDIYDGFVYEYEDLTNARIAYYNKDITNIKSIDIFNDAKSLNINKLLLANKKRIDKITKIQLSIIPSIYKLRDFQNAIHTDLFVNKYKLTLNNEIELYNYNDTLNFNYYCSLLPKSACQFYVFRKQRLSSTYNPGIQFNSKKEERYLLPFSTSSSYEFVYKWNGINNGLILIINVPSDTNYMVSYNQSQYEITLPVGILQYTEKGYYNNQPTIICDFIQSN